MTTTTPQSERDVLAERLLAAKSAYIISHITPDADTLGAALGLGLSLRGRGMRVRFACEDPVPAELRFLPGAQEFTSQPFNGEEIIVSVDTSDVRRIGKLYDEQLFRTVPVLVIDHHITNTRFGTLNWVTDVPATSEMILELLQARQIPVSLEAATCLLAGIIGDTQCFKTTSTTPSSLLAAAQLQQMGAPLNQIAMTVLNQRPISALAAWRQAFMTAYREPGIIITSLDYQFLQSSGADDSSTNGLSSWLIGLEDVQISAVLKESDKGYVDVSMRSVAAIDISGAASSLGGGGHPQAAGCVLHESLLNARIRLLAALRPLVRRAPR